VAVTSASFASSAGTGLPGRTTQPKPTETAVGAAAAAAAVLLSMLEPTCDADCRGCGGCCSCVVYWARSCERGAVGVAATWGGGGETHRVGCRSTTTVHVFSSSTASSPSTLLVFSCGECAIAASITCVGAGEKEAATTATVDVADSEDGVLVNTGGSGARPTLPAIDSAARAVRRRRSQRRAHSNTANLCRSADGIRRYAASASLLAVGSGRSGVWWSTTVVLSSPPLLFSPPICFVS